MEQESFAKTFEYPKEYVVWDLETTGLDPTKDEILEVCAMYIKNGEVVKTHTGLINHGLMVPILITQITGITQEMIEKDGKPVMEVLKPLIEMIEAAPAHITHNGYRFDLKFLTQSIFRHYGEFIYQQRQFSSTLEKRMIDTAVLYKASKMNMPRRFNETFTEYAERVMSMRVMGLKYNVGVCCDYFGIDQTGKSRHRAEADVHFTNEIFKKLCLTQ